MAVLLDKTSKTVLLKLTIQEYKKISQSLFFDEEKLSNYKFVLGKLVKASSLSNLVKEDMLLREIQKSKKSWIHSLNSLDDLDK